VAGRGGDRQADLPKAAVERALAPIGIPEAVTRPVASYGRASVPPGYCPSPSARDGRVAFGLFPIAGRRPFVVCGRSYNVRSRAWLEPHPRKAIVRDSPHYQSRLDSNPRSAEVVYRLARWWHPSRAFGESGNSGRDSGIATVSTDRGLIHDRLAASRTCCLLAVQSEIAVCSSLAEIQSV
jgi:hypothetical protein